MTVVTSQLGRTLTHPWASAAAVAAVFVALEGLMAGVDLVVFFARAGEQIEDRWAILGDDWLRYALYLIIGLAAGYILRLAARGEVTHEWPTLMLRAVLVYLPVSLVLNFAVAFMYAVTHDLPLHFFGLQVLG